MSKPITVTIPHRLGKEEATRRLKAGIGSARGQFGPILSVTDEVWTEHNLSFTVAALGQTAAGSIDVADDHVALNVQLPGLLGAFADMIRSRVSRQATLLLEKK